MGVVAGRLDGPVVPQVFEHFAATLVALVGLFFQRPHDYRADPRMNGRINLPWGNGLFVDDLVDHRGDVLSRERFFAGHHFIEHHAQREDVAAAIYRAALHLFRRHVARGAHYVGGLLDGAELQNFCRAEVCDLDGIVGGEHEVRGLDVAVNDVPLMRELQRAASLIHDAQRARQRKGVAVIEQCLQTFSLHQFHGDVVQAVFFARVENHHDVGMRQQTCGTRFGLESRQEFGVREPCAFFAQPDGFDRNGAPDHRIYGFVDNAHRAAAQFTDDFVSSGFCYSWHRQIDLSPRKDGTSYSNPNSANRVAGLERRDT